jgi:hypothetical protein
MDNQDLIDEVHEALQNAQDYNTTLTDFAKAVVRDVPLIAAAPQLLEALQMVMSLYGDGFANDAQAYARAALAAAAPTEADRD